MVKGSPYDLTQVRRGLGSFSVAIVSRRVLEAAFRFVTARKRDVQSADIHFGNSKVRRGFGAITRDMKSRSWESIRGRCVHYQMKDEKVVG